MVFGERLDRGKREDATHVHTYIHTYIQFSESKLAVEEEAWELSFERSEMVCKYARMYKRIAVRSEFFVCVFYACA
jgi:hypothetical protein